MIRNLHSELTGQEALTKTGIEIEWSDISVEADALVGSSVLPSLFQVAKATAEAVLPCVCSTQQHVNLVVLKNISGQLKPVSIIFPPLFKYFILLML